MSSNEYREGIHESKFVGSLSISGQSIPVVLQLKFKDPMTSTFIVESGGSVLFTLDFMWHNQEAEKEVWVGVTKLNIADHTIGAKSVGKIRDRTLTLKVTASEAVTIGQASNSEFEITAKEQA